MAISVFPVAVTSSSSVNAVAAAPGDFSKQYMVTRNFSAGVYTISVSNSTDAYIEFFNATSSVLFATTSGGTVTVNLASDCTNAVVTLLTSASASVTINQTALTLVSSEISGTLDTITTTSTYSQTGRMYVLCVGGGGGGAQANTDVGEGGRGASMNGRLVYTNTSTSITVGSGGTGAAAGTNGNGGAGGTTSFGSLVSATGGAGGRFTWRTNPSYSATNYWRSIKVGQTNSGGGGANAGNGIDTYNNMMADNGLGVGGRGGTTSSVGSGPGFRDGENASGYGNGGGSGFLSTGKGGNGSPGVVYILRF